MLQCLYVDRTTTEDLGALAAETERLKKRGLGELLITCHRIEAYDAADLPIENRNLEIGIVRSTAGVLERLARIAAGTQSQILGEWPILEQVRKFTEATLRPRVKDLGEAALRIAENCRREEDFYSPDHARLALIGIRERTRAEVLLIFGAGMLGLRLARDYDQLGFSQAMLVTRHPKKAGRKVGGDSKCVLVTLEQALKQGAPSLNTTVVLASTDVSTDRRKAIERGFLNSPSCKGVLDVCGKPLFPEAPGHVTLTSPLMDGLIHDHNQKMAERAARIVGTIQASAPTIAENLELKWKGATRPE